MKAFNVTLILILTFSGFTFSENKEILDEDVIYDKMEVAIMEFHDRKIAELPASVRRELLRCKSEEDLNEIRSDAQAWLSEAFAHGGDPSITDVMEKIQQIRTADDAAQILRKTFWSKLHGKPLQLKQKIERVGMYWAENDRPRVRFSPRGKSEVHWIWKLPVSDRPHGVIHVGIDETTR